MVGNRLDTPESRASYLSRTYEETRFAMVIDIQLPSVEGVSRDAAMWVSMISIVCRRFLFSVSLSLLPDREKVCSTSE